MVTEGAKKRHLCSVTEAGVRRGVSTPPMEGVYVVKGVSLFTQWILSLSRVQISSGACFPSADYRYESKQNSCLI